MKSKVVVRQVLIDCICFAFIVLFVYAAVNKWLDFQNFQVQLAQSPLLSAFAGPVSHLVPIAEVIISLLLAVPKYRKIGLYLAFSLMTMFSVYIIIILKFSPFVPCSCGGILEEMTWTQHLIFNFVFVFLAAAGILTGKRFEGSNAIFRTTIVGVLITAILSSGVVAVLFLISEDMIHRRNNFTRRFPNHPVEFVRDFKLPTGQYYFAGTGNGAVYIGNIGNALRVIEADTALTRSKTHMIDIRDDWRKYRTLRVTVKYPYFFLSDVSEAFIYRGTTDDWKAEIWVDKKVYFNSFAPIDSNRIAIRSVSSADNKNILGILEGRGRINAYFNPKLLDTQIDGIFDTDGKLLYNDVHDKIIYVYSYRNQFLITDPKLAAKSVGRTIDTTSRAKIKVEYVKSIDATTLASPARGVNRTAATHSDYLFVNSELIGQYENRSMWKEASIIDIYNLATQHYLFSFYLYDKEQKKISEFIADRDHVYTLAGRILSVYRIDKKSFLKNQ